MCQQMKSVVPDALHISVAHMGWWNVSRSTGWKNAINALNFLARKLMICLNAPLAIKRNAGRCVRKKNMRCWRKRFLTSEKI